MLTNKLLINAAVLLNKPKVSSRGNRRHTHSILKKSCNEPPVIALLNSSRRPICPKDTSVFVTVVPIFAPSIIGTALATFRIPEPTIPTIIEVVVDELWTRLVARTPINNPTKGLEVVAIRFLAKSLPNPLNAVPIRPMLIRNK